MSRVVFICTLILLHSVGFRESSLIFALSPNAKKKQQGAKNNQPLTLVPRAVPPMLSTTSPLLAIRRCQPPAGSLQSAPRICRCGLLHWRTRT